MRQLEGEIKKREEWNRSEEGGGSKRRPWLCAHGRSDGNGHDGGRDGLWRRSNRRVEVADSVVCGVTVRALEEGGRRRWGKKKERKRNEMKEMRKNTRK